MSVCGTDDVGSIPTLHPNALIVQSVEYIFGMDMSPVQVWVGAQNATVCSSVFETVICNGHENVGPTPISGTINICPNVGIG